MKKNIEMVVKSVLVGFLGTAFSVSTVQCPQSRVNGGLAWYLSPVSGNHCPRENGDKCCSLLDYFEGADDYCTDFRDGERRQQGF